jgi:hypothetical protein
MMKEIDVKMDANQTKVDGIEDEMLVRMREDLNVVWQK